VTTTAEDKLFAAHCFAIQLSARRRARKHEIPTVPGDPRGETAPTTASSDDCESRPQTRTSKCRSGTEQPRAHEEGGSE
jgi:hypothetical protein